MGDTFSLVYGQGKENWHTVEDLSALCGFNVNYLRNNIKSMLVGLNFDVETKREGKSHQIYYSEEDSTRVQKTATDLEILEDYKRANADFMALLSRKYEEEKQKREFAENTINRLSDSRGCYSMNQTAKALKLHERLRAERILNSDNSPNQEQINSGHFKVVIKFINDKVGSKAVTLTTNKGLSTLRKSLTPK